MEELIAFALEHKSYVFVCVGSCVGIVLIFILLKISKFKNK